MALWIKQCDHLSKMKLDKLIKLNNKLDNKSVQSQVG